MPGCGWVTGFASTTVPFSATDLTNLVMRGEAGVA